MNSRRDRYQRANIRGGLGVRKRLSEESLRETYRLNGVQTGSVIARAHDKYFGDFTKGYDLGMLVRKTASTVQIHWLGDEDATPYQQGDARYEVDRGRWKVLGPLQGNPLDADNALVDALTKLRRNARMLAGDQSPTPPTEETENDMANGISKAAQERAMAAAAAANGDLKERETYTAKQVATRCGTDSKTMRKFFRSSHSTVEPVGQGGRYEFDAKDLPKIRKEFESWRKKSAARRTDTKPTPEEAKVAQDAAAEDEEFTAEEVAQALVDQRLQEEAEHFGDTPFDPADYDPTEEDLAELEEVDLDDLDED